MRVLWCYRLKPRTAVHAFAKDFFDCPVATSVCGLVDGRGDWVTVVRGRVKCGLCLVKVQRG